MDLERERSGSSTPAPSATTPAMSTTDRSTADRDGDARRHVSVCYIVKNEARRIEESLRSVAWADEIVVVDSGSDDGTVEICRRYTDRVIHQDFLGHIEQKNFALDRASHDWVLSLDGDEVLSDDLAREIREVLAAPDEDVDGYRMPRQTRYLGRWIRHGSWYPDHKLRLWRRTAGRWGGENPHDRVEVAKDRVATLRSPILHYSYRDVSHHVQTIDAFTSITAREWHRRGRRARLSALVLRPPLKFLEVYVWKRGFLDGVPGFLIAFHTMYYAFLKYAKLLELEKGSDDA